MRLRRVPIQIAILLFFVSKDVLDDIIWVLSLRSNTGAKHFELVLKPPCYRAGQRFALIGAQRIDPV